MRKRRKNYPPPLPLNNPNMLDWDIDRSMKLLRTGTWQEFSGYMLGKRDWTPEKIKNAWLAVRGEIDE